MAERIAMVPEIPVVPETPVVSETPIVSEGPRYSWESGAVRRLSDSDVSFYSVHRPSGSDRHRFGACEPNRWGFWKS